MSVDIYFLIENGNAKDSVFVFRLAFMVSPKLLKVSPAWSPEVWVMSVYLIEEGKIFPRGKKQ